MVDLGTKSGKAALVLAGMAFGIATAALLGWLGGLDLLPHLTPGARRMNPATAVALMLAAVALAFFLVPPRARALVLAARGSALLAALVGLAGLVGWLTPWDLWAVPWVTALGFPPRMAPNSALNLLLLGGAIFLVDQKTRAARYAVQFATLVAGLISLLALLGYAYDQASLGGNGLPFFTALTSALLVGAILFAQTDQDRLAILTSDRAGGAMLRRLLPAAIIIPGLLGWLARKGELAGFYDSGLGAAGAALGNILIFALLAWWSAAGIAQADRRHRQAEETERASEERFAGALEHAPIGMALLSVEGRWLRVNRILCSMLDYAEYELIGHFFHGVTHPDDLADCVDQVQRMTAGEAEAWQSEKRYVSKSGAVVVVAFNLALVRDARGQPSYFIAQIQNITERQRVETALQESQARYRSLFENMVEGYAYCQLVFSEGRPRDYFYQEVNSAFGMQTGLHDVVGKKVSAVVPGIHESNPEQLELYARVAETGVPVRFESYAEPLGIWFSVSVYSQEKGHFVVIFDNITERKRADLELRGKTAFLEALVNSSPDGMLVVSGERQKLLQNQRLCDLLKIPRHVAEDQHDEQQLQWVAGTIKGQEQFLARVVYLNDHPHETSRDEIELKDGTVLDRYSAPVLGQDGKYYGRIWQFRDVTERQRMEESLRLLSSAVEQSKEAIMITDAELDFPGPRIIFINSAFAKMTGYAAPEILGKNPRIFQGPRTDRAVIQRLRRNLASGQEFAGETFNYRRDGSEYLLEWQIAPIVREDGKITHFVAVERDITERRHLQLQVFEAQKIENVGQLAGGIAHEFNGILTAILGQSDLLLRHLPSGSPLTRHATEISKAAHRAAQLTRQLLAFGRQQLLQPEILDLHQVVAGLATVLQQLLGSEVALCIVPSLGSHFVKADAGQLEQVILNMALNARQAMPHGGQLRLETTHLLATPGDATASPNVPPVPHVVLAITDNGEGMKPEVMARIFEPFYSTKGIGGGTGLGLSTCEGIIKQSGGTISVQSEPGRGTTFKIYLPAADATSAHSAPKVPPQP